MTEFVGFLAGFRKGGEPQLAFGLLGAVVTLWATFAPCFLWIFVGAPYVERLRTSPRLAGALAAVTAAVVGVILNLSLWFALHVLFGSITATWYGPVADLDAGTSDTECRSSCACPYWPRRFSSACIAASRRPSR
ncbi:MAG: chromate transporter [Actinomycetota bacterium]